MKVRHILPEFGLIPDDPTAGSMSGVVSAAFSLAKRQGENGLASELVGMRQNGRDDRDTNPAIIGIQPWRFAHIGPYNFRVFAPMKFRLSRAGTADINHSHVNPYHLSMGRSRRRVLHLHTPIKGVPDAYRQAVRNQADAVIACSTFIRGQFLSEVDFPEDRVYTVYGGLDMSRFRVGDQRALRERFGLPQDGFIIMYAGQINEQKGLAHAVEALRRLGRDDVYLAVIGSSKLWHGARQGFEDYENRVKADAGGLNVIFMGKQPFHDMPDLYAAADLFVLPSVWDEPFGLVGVEASACGLPVVASDVGGIGDGVIDGETGLLVPPADPDAIAGALRRLIDDADLRARMRENGLQHAKKFDLSAIAAQVNGVYEDIAGVDRLG